MILGVTVKVLKSMLMSLPSASALVDVSKYTSYSAAIFLNLAMASFLMVLSLLACLLSISSCCLKTRIDVSIFYSYMAIAYLLISFYCSHSWICPCACAFNFWINFSASAWFSLRSAISFLCLLMILSFCFRLSSLSSPCFVNLSSAHSASRACSIRPRTLYSCCSSSTF